MKILIITQWFDPEPTLKGLLFATELVKAGHEVEVVTGVPNYPGGKIYDGYKIRFHSKEIVNGVTVHRVPLYASHDGVAIQRMFNYISFAVTSSICGIFIRIKPDIIYCYHPPLTTALSAMVVSFFKKAPFVIDVQDLWPDTLMATGMIRNSKILSLVNFLCEFVYLKSSKVIVLSSGFKKKLIERGVPEQKLEVIYNWCDERMLQNAVSSEEVLPDNHCFNLLFAGNLGYAQGLPSIIDAAKILQDKKVKVNVVFLGDGVAKESALIQVEFLHLENVFFLPRVPMLEVGSLLKHADALLVHLTNDELFSITIPSRTQAYLAIGKPIIMGVNGDAADLINRSKAGEVCEPNNPISLANAIISMVSKTVIEREVMAKRALLFYKNELSLSIGVGRFISVFEEVKK
jgi:colanic acid biosynthesis glycosyl transferase WcaI